MHGTIGGITSVLQGGKFGHGFASAGFAAAATFFNNSNYIHKNSNGFSWRRVAIGAAIGGTASKLSGGKFANGAMTGAFSQALNSESNEGRGRSPNDVFRQKYQASRASKIYDIDVEITPKVGYGEYAATATGTMDGDLAVGGSLEFGNVKAVKISGALTVDPEGVVTIHVEATRQVLGPALEVGVGGGYSNNGAIHQSLGVSTPIIDAAVVQEQNIAGIIQNVTAATTAFFDVLPDYLSSISHRNLLLEH